MKGGREKGENRGPVGSGVREEGADVGRGFPVFWRPRLARAGRSGRKEPRGAPTYSEWCGRRLAVAFRSSPRAAGSVPRGPAAGSRSRSWPRTGLAPGPALCRCGHRTSFRRRRSGERCSRDTAPQRTGIPTGGHPGPEASLLRVGLGEASAEARPRDFRRRGGTSGFVAEVAEAVPWQ